MFLSVTVHDKTEQGAYAVEDEEGIKSYLPI